MDYIEGAKNLGFSELIRLEIIIHFGSEIT